MTASTGSTGGKLELFALSKAVTEGTGSRFGRGWHQWLTAVILTDGCYCIVVPSIPQNN